MSAQRSGTLRAGGVPFRMCLLFAFAPDESLTSTDVATKYDMLIGNVPSTLSTAVRSGWLAKKKVIHRHGWESIYSAGPNLLEALGL